ncbi:MAG: asparaginase [Thermovirga sp.]|nr:asparaginase [Thermovirga sp.]
MSKRGKVAFVGTGGTISMTYSDRQGGLIPTESAGSILEAVPENYKGNLEIIDWGHQPSSHYTIRMTVDLVQLLYKLVQDGISGIVIACGTDTLEEMAYLTDLLWPYPQPIIFTGAMLPIGTPGSEAASNLIQSLTAASCERLWGMGVLTCLQDQLFAASEVAKEIGHRKDAFYAPGRGPVGEFVDGQIYIIRKPKRPPFLGQDIHPASKIAVLWATLGGGEETLSCLAENCDLDGLILAGFGAGNISPSWIKYLKPLLKKGLPIVITSRCHKGHTSIQYAYEGSTKKLLEMGVYDGGWLRPHQARLRLAVALGAGLKGENLQKYLKDEL